MSAQRFPDTLLESLPQTLKPLPQTLKSRYSPLKSRYPPVKSRYRMLNPLCGFTRVRRTGWCCSTCHGTLRTTSKPPTGANSYQERAGV
eukprot:901382-Rhodomonas_salina.2